MIHLTPIQLVAITVVAPLVVVGLCHALVHLFLALKMPKVAAWIARNTTTITTLLPTIEDQVLLGPSAVLLARDLDAAAKAAPDDAKLTRWAAMARKVAGGVAVTCLASVAIGCTSTNDAIRSAAEVSNAVAQFESLAAIEVHDRCTAPMEHVAIEPEGPARVDAAKALAKTCDPLEEAYDGTRRAHLAVLAALSQLARGGITVGGLFDLVEQLTTAAAALEKEIAKP